jgi:cysteine-rich repeat protein
MTLHNHKRSMRIWELVVAAIAAVSLSACLPEQLVDCGDNRFCAAGSVCATHTSAVIVCASANALESCRQLVAGATCDQANDEQGICEETNQGLVCLPTLCGDGIQSRVEACDDGNLVSGDGCSRDCTSNETCGNGTVDGSVSEQCDDGGVSNLPGAPKLDGDRCSSKCRVEADTWTLVTEQGLPVSAMATGFDPRRGVWLAITSNATAEFDGVSWQNSECGGWCTQAHTAIAMTYDLNRRVMVLVATSAIGFETWENDGAMWRQLPAASPQPSSRARGAVAYDDTIKMVVLVGSQLRMPAPEMWAFDGKNWMLLSNPPLSFAGHSLVRDTKRNRTILFGGEVLRVNQRTDNFATYEFDGTEWYQLSSESPFPPQNAVGVYDPILQRVLAVSRGETWELEIVEATGAPPTGRWKRLSPISSPPSASIASVDPLHLVYDSKRHRILALVATNLGNAFQAWSYGYSNASSVVESCIAGEDTDGDGLSGCGDGLVPSDPTHNADPDCYGICFPLCPLPSNQNNIPCDLTGLPYCGDQVCNESLEDKFICPADCPN